MNKTYTIIVILVILIVLGGVGYAIWSGYNPGVVSPVTTSTDTSNTNTAPVAQVGAPIVVTNATNVPYISTVVINGTVNPNGALTTYWYEYGQTSSLGAKTVVYLVGSGYTNFYTPAYITGLNSDTTYYYRLAANNSFGTVNGATYSFKTNTNPPPSGVSPTTSTTSATSITKTSANLNGQINPNGSQTNFWFEYGLASDLGLVTSLQSAGSTDSSQAISVSISNLKPSTKYYFRLNSQNQFGTVNGQILDFTTQGPSTATAPTTKTNSATAVTNSSAKLNADINPNGATTTYWFEYSNNALLSNLLVTSTTKQTLDAETSPVNASANINDLNNNTKYYFRSVAQNQYGTVIGDISSFTTKK